MAVSAYAIVTSSKVLQLPFVMVHRKTYVPYNDTVAVDAGLAELLNATVPGPEIFVQSPEPAEGLLAARVATRTPHFC